MPPLLSQVLTASRFSRSLLRSRVRTPGGHRADEDALESLVRRALQHVAERVAQVVGDRLMIRLFSMAGDFFDLAAQIVGDGSAFEHVAGAKWRRPGRRSIPPGHVQQRKRRHGGHRLFIASLDDERA